MKSVLPKRPSVLHWSLAVILTCSTLAISGCNDKGPERPNPPPGKKNALLWYQLVSVTIPPDSPLRKIKFDGSDGPPDIYVIVRTNGEKDGRTTSSTGWQVDFPYQVANQFPIRIRSAARYTIEVWDEDYGFWNTNDNIFNITQVKGEEFAEKIYQKGGDLDVKSRLAYTVWKQVSTPKKFRKPDWKQNE